MLTLFCKSIAKEHKVEVENLRDDVPDEVIDVDMAKIKDFFNNDAWIEIQRRGVYIHI